MSKRELEDSELVDELEYLKYAVMMMIMEKMYDEALRFLNVSPEINKMLEDNILKHYHKVDLKKKIIKLSDSIIDKCFSSKTSEEKINIRNDIRKYLYDIFVERFKSLGFHIYKRYAYRNASLTLNEMPLLMDGFFYRSKILNYLTEKYGGSCSQQILFFPF